MIYVFNRKKSIDDIVKPLEGIVDQLSARALENANAVNENVRKISELQDINEQLNAESERASRVAWKIAGLVS